MLALNVKPIKIIFSKVLAALCEAGNMKKVQWLFDDGVESGLIPDVISYIMMIYGYCR